MIWRISFVYISWSALHLLQMRCVYRCWMQQGRRIRVVSFSHSLCLCWRGLTQKNRQYTCIFALTTIRRLNTQTQKHNKKIKQVRDYTMLSFVSVSSEHLSRVYTIAGSKTSVFNIFSTKNMWLLVILVTTVLFALRYYYDSIHAFWLSLKIDGPPALPILGNALMFINKTPAGMQPLHRQFVLHFWMDGYFVLLLPSDWMK